MFRGRKMRYLLRGPIGRKLAYLALENHRMKCMRCGSVQWPKLPFAEGKHRFTRSFALTVLDLLRFGTIRSVATHLGLGCDLVKEIHRSKLRLEINCSSKPKKGIKEYPSEKETALQ